MAHLIKADLNWFLPYDLLTIIIAVVILSLIILVTGLASAVSNTLFAWILFHAFLGILLLVELLTSWITSDPKTILDAAHQTWLAAGADEITEMQLSLHCCGFGNETDRPSDSDCPDAPLESCRSKLNRTITVMRDVASVSMFVDFVFALFIDFAGCGICFHPDVITLEQVRAETQLAESIATSEYISGQIRSGNGAISML
jgi:hypothetical protein